MSNWRLPTKAECLAIELLPEQTKSEFKSALLHNDDVFWTSTEHDIDDKTVFAFNLDHCSLTFTDKYFHHRSRLVRPTQLQTSSESRFVLAPCCSFITDTVQGLDWKVEAHPSVSPWPRAMWKFNGVNVLSSTQDDLQTCILAVQNALVGKPESLHFDRLLSLMTSER